MINDHYDIETCTWCNGEGKDLARKGQPHNQPDCIRCQGSGKIYVTSEMATTKKRRKYMGAVPKPQDIVLTINETPSLASRLTEPDGIIQPIPEPKRRGRKPGSKNQPKVRA